MQHRHALTLLTFCAVLGHAVAAAPESGHTVVLARFEGEWVRHDRERDDDARATAIEAASQHMSVWYRGIARTMMRASMRPDEGYRIRAIPDGLSIANGDDEPRELRIEAAAQEVDGSVVRVHLAGDTIEEHWRHSESSHGTTRWAVTDGALVITVEAYDARLRDADGNPVPIRYATTYSPSAAATRPRLER